LDEAEAAESHAPNLTDEFTGRTSTTAARSVLGAGFLLR
jgi:hypothetical protein